MWAWLGGGSLLWVCHWVESVMWQWFCRWVESVGSGVYVAGVMFSRVWVESGVSGVCFEGVMCGC